jgi:hypothetical protein
MKSWFFVFFLLASIVTEASAAYVAVLETVADERAKDSVSLPDRQYLTNVLREQAIKELPATQNYTIMTRDNINAMLPPGMVLEECEGSCLAETGRNISADFICQARVGRFGGMLTMTAELYETAGNKLIASFNGRGTNVNELLDIIEQRSPEFFRSVRELAEPAVADTAKPVVEEAKPVEEKPAETQPVETQPEQVNVTESAVAENEPAPAVKTGESIPANVEVKGSGVARWVILGLGSAAAITGGVLAYLGNKKAKDAAEDSEDSYSDLEKYRDKAESGQTMRTIGLVVLAVGVVGIGVSFAF